MNFLLGKVKKSIKIVLIFALVLCVNLVLVFTHFGHLREWVEIYTCENLYQGIIFASKIGVISGWQNVLFPFSWSTLNKEVIPIKCKYIPVAGEISKGVLTEKMFRKYTVNLRRKTHAKLLFQEIFFGLDWTSYTLDSPVNLLHNFSILFYESTMRGCFTISITQENLARTIIFVFFFSTSNLSYRLMFLTLLRTSLFHIS